MQLHKESHVDHGLSQAQLKYILERFADREAFFIETIELPDTLGTVPSAIYGPIVGDAPVVESEVRYARRGSRKWTSRLCTRPVRQSRLVTVIAGPHDDKPCVLYTAFGGPCAPQEPGDPGCKDVIASEKFWSEHALAE